jgi:hypothetical protein
MEECFDWHEALVGNYASAVIVIARVSSVHQLKASMSWRDCSSPLLLTV